MVVIILSLFVHWRPRNVLVEEKESLDHFWVWSIESRLLELFNQIFIQNTVGRFLPAFAKKNKLSPQSLIRMKTCNFDIVWMSIDLARAQSQERHVKPQTTLFFYCVIVCCVYATGELWFVGKKQKTYFGEPNISNKQEDLFVFRLDELLMLAFRWFSFWIFSMGSQSREGRAQVRQAAQVDWPRERNDDNTHTTQRHRRVWTTTGYAPCARRRKMCASREKNEERLK